MKFGPLLAAALSLSLASTALAQDVAPWGRGESRPEDLTVTLVTFGPGSEIISWWGHTALAVEDRRLKHGRLYNYGMFSFDEGMLRRFALGRLEFWVGEAAVYPTYAAYRMDGRDVRLQVLNLSPQKRLELAQALSNNVQPKNREYLYHHYLDNCSTRPRDQIDRVVNGQFQAQHTGPGRMTLREHTRRYTAVNPPMSVFLDFMMNNEIDRPITQWNEAFLPDELERQLDTSSYINEEGQKVPLVAEKRLWFKSSTPPTPEAPPRYGPWIVGIGLALGGLFALLGWLTATGRRAARVALGLLHAVLALVLGIPGTALLVMWLFTDHTVTFHNENLFLASPLTLAAFPVALAFAFGGKNAARRLWLLFRALVVLSLLGLLLKVLPPFNQDNWRLVALILPINLGLAAAYGWVVGAKEGIKSTTLAGLLFSR